MTSPQVSGLHTSDSEWHLDVSQYESFIEEATGISVTGDLDATDCYRIGNRLEALITEHQQHGEWTEDLAEDYPDVASRKEIVGLARFFRECHTCRLEEHATS
jgi:hypothetical protein